MKKIYKYAFWVTLVFFICTVTLFFTNLMPGFALHKASASPLDAVTQDNPVIQIALLLDTSGSMSGLIDQAKAHLWNIVNELAGTTKNGRVPELRVALYEYGKDSLPAFSGYIRKIAPLTTDMDYLYEELFALTTSGGDEFCGMVIDKALAQLEWSGSEDDLKIIFIAGNEFFSQGSYNYKTVCKKAVDRGIIINTLYCGDRSVGIEEQWQDAASRGNGKYLVINHNQEIIEINAPQDDEIAQLNAALNDTYIPYGTKGASLKERQTVQDTNAMSMNAEVLIQRAAAKSTSNYSNDSWDLVDGVKNKTIDIDSLKTKDLPGEMRHMSKKERKEYVQTMEDKRTEIQDQIQELYKEREIFVTNKRMEMNGDEGFDTILMEAISEQASLKGFSEEK